MFIEKIHGFWELSLGTALMSLSFWGPMLDKAMAGAHMVAAFGGAIVAVHGLFRIIRRTFGKHRRREDG